VDKITVFNDKNEIVGKTFARRAKQLVMKERAKWADNAHTAINLLEADHKEEKINMEIFSNKQDFIDKALDEKHEKAELPSEPSDDLLMYLAKQNVEKRRNLRINAIALPVAFIAIYIISGGFSANFGNLLHWDFVLGVFVTWGAILVYRIFMYQRARFVSRFSKADPVKEEYERLKRHF